MTPPASPQQKCIAPHDIAAWRRSLPSADPIAVVAGTFDILQPGNLLTLLSAARVSPHVCVVLDASCPHPARAPRHSLAQRAEFLSYLHAPSAITSFPPHLAPDYFAALRPYAFLSGPPDPFPDPLAAAARTAAARCIVLPHLPMCRTTDIEHALRDAHTPIPVPTHAYPLHPPPSPAALRHMFRSRRLVSVNGCFDVLHIGHLRFLADAASHGDRLVLLINDDASVRRYKGPTRPVFPASFRVPAMEALSSVSRVIPFAEDTPLATLQDLHPDVHVKGGTYEADRVRGEEALLASWNGALAFSPLVEGYSTTAYIERVLSLL